MFVFTFINTALIIYSLQIIIDTVTSLSNMI